MTCSSRAYVFIDTCSLLDSCWKKASRGYVSFTYSETKARNFWEREFRSLESVGAVIVPMRNYEELQRHASNSKKPELAARAQHIIKLISGLIRDQRIEIVGDSNDPFADAILLSVALKFRTQNNMVFITQDRKLAHDLEAIRHFESVRPREGYDIKVRRITSDGYLGMHRGVCKAGQLFEKGESFEDGPIKCSSSRDCSEIGNWWD